MYFDIDKCSAMYIEKFNHSHEYARGILTDTGEDRYLGVIIHRSTNPLRHCMKAAKKASRLLGMSEEQ